MRSQTTSSPLMGIMSFAALPGFIQDFSPDSHMFLKVNPVGSKVTLDVSWYYYDKC